MPSRPIPPPVLVIGACLFSIICIVTVLGLSQLLPPSHSFTATGQPQLFMWQQGNVVHFEAFVGSNSGTQLDFSHGKGSMVLELTSPAFEAYIYDNDYKIFLPNFEGAMTAIFEYGSEYAHKINENKLLRIEIAIHFPNQPEYSRGFDSTIFEPSIELVEA